MSELRKYGVLLTTAKSLQFVLFEPDGINYEVATTFAAGDVKISKDGGAEANVTNLPTTEGQGYRLILTAAELTASRIRIAIVDSATKLWLDSEIYVETYGNASAMHAFDLDNTTIATVTNLTNLPSIPANWLTAAGIAASALNGKGNWNIGKTGYSLSQAFPANFASLVITAGGAVDALLQGFLNTLIAETTAGRIAANFDNFYDNGDAVATLTLDLIALQSLLSTVNTATAGLGGAAMRGTDGANTTVPDNSGIAGIQTDLDNATDGLGALKALLDLAMGGTFSSATDSLEAIRDNGDINWITGGGGSNPTVLQSTTIATLASQTSFTLTAGSADNKAYQKAMIVVTDQTTDTQKAVGFIKTYTGGSLSIVLYADPAVFTMAVGDTVDIIAVNTEGVWRDKLTDYVNGEAGKRLKGITAVPQAEGTVNDASATTTLIRTTLTGYQDDNFKDGLFLVEIAADQWQGRPVLTSDGTTGDITLAEPLTSAPADGIAISIKATHTHPVEQIVGAITQGVAFDNFEFPMVLSSDHYTAATGLTVTGQRSLDGGSWANVTGVISEVGSGLYVIDLTAADTNGKTISYKFSAGTADDTFTPTVMTRQ